MDASTAYLIGQVVAASGAIIAGARWLTPKVQRGVHLYNTLGQLPEQLASIAAELKPNGGGSMRDAVNRIELGQHVNRATMRAYSETPEFGRFETNEKGECGYADRTFLRWVQRTPDEVKGWGYLNCICDDEREDVREAVETNVRQGAEFSRRLRLQPVDGPLLEVHCRATVLRHPANGAVLGWVWTIRRPEPRPTPAHMRPDDGA